MPCYLSPIWKLNVRQSNQQTVFWFCIFQVQTHFSAPSHTKSLKGLKVSSSSFFPPVLSLASSNQTSSSTFSIQTGFAETTEDRGHLLVLLPIPSETINKAYHPPLQLWHYLLYLICFFILSSLIFGNSDSREKCILVYPCHLKPCLAKDSRYVILVEQSC